MKIGKVRLQMSSVCSGVLLLDIFATTCKPSQGMIYGPGGWSGLNLLLLLLRLLVQEKLSFFFRTSCPGCIFVCCRLIENEFIPTEGLLFLIQFISFCSERPHPSSLHRFLCFFEEVVVVGIFFCNNTTEIFSQSLEAQYLMELENS